VRILWHSSCPEGISGYSNITREMVRRLVQAGHFVRVATKHEYLQWHIWEGVEAVEGTDIDFMNRMLLEEDFDYVITLWDIWALRQKRQFPKEKWVAWVPIDTEWIAGDLAEVCLNAGQTVAMSHHGERELRSIGLEPQYAPLAIDTGIFKHKPKGRQAFREAFEWTEDNFIIGSVGLNYGDDRKGFITLMRAFKEFHQMHPEARLYIHSLANEMNKVSQGVNYAVIANNLGIAEWLAWPNQPDYFLGRTDEAQLADVYSGMDVFCLPTKGEGFGMPIVEAQACGTPVVVTDSTAGPELRRAGWLIETDKLDDACWLPNRAWRIEPRVSPTIDALEKAWRAWKDKDEWPELCRQARNGVLKYDWDTVWSDHWEPILRRLNERLPRP
jgi:glycosyltransferase involved in cell wall biosynthesis